MERSDINIFDLMDIERYGSTLATYRGTGLLKFEKDQESHCDFLLGQMKSGDIVVLCYFPDAYLIPFPTPVAFMGISVDGDRLQSVGPLMEFNFLPLARHPNSPGTAAAIYVRELVVTIQEQTPPRRLKYGITNFEVAGSDRGQGNDNQYRVLPLDLVTGRQRETVIIAPVQDYESSMLRARTLKSVDVTAEVIIDPGDDFERSYWDEVVDDLCYILSVARGTKIQWVYCDSYIDSALIGRRHVSRVTKQWCPMPTINAGYEGAKETRDFIENVYPTFVRNKDVLSLKRGTIDRYLDARIEGDYLQTRALKLAIVVEGIKQVYLDRPDSSIRSHIFPQSEYGAEQIHEVRDEIKDHLKSTLKNKGVSAEQRGEMYAKVEELFRRPFGNVLADIFEELGIAADQELVQFRRSRDCLVHQGRFASQVLSEEEKQAYPRLANKLSEFFFLVHFADRMILGMLGYNGPYQDWSDPYQMIRKDSVSGQRRDIY